MDPAGAAKAGESGKDRVPDETVGRCPVCRMRFSGVRYCPRCGADLYRLMWLTVRAWRRRTLAPEKAPGQS